jgi:branched-chain amino acid transport system permease protein
MAYTKNFVLAIFISGISIAIIGVLMERFFLHRLYKQPEAQVLLTIGFTFLFADTALMIWGGAPYFIDKPEAFMKPIMIGQRGFPSYRFLVIFVGALIAGLLWLFQEKTRAGAMVRASVNDEEMARGLGINVPLLFTQVFGLGAFLAGVCGVMGGSFVGAYPGADFEILNLTLVVIIVGGIGSLKGAIVGSLLIGLVDNFGKVFFPELALVTVFAPMAIILAIKPSGLFGSGG